MASSDEHVSQASEPEMVTMSVPQGSFDLSRIPDRSNLRAWDAADEYVLEHLAEVGGPVGPVIVVNDSFGALACALHDLEPVSWSDSYLAHLATVDNFEANNIDPASVKLVPASDGPVPASENFGTVIIKVPKTLALLEYQLRLLRQHVGPDTVVIAAGMSKHVHSSTLELFETILGPTTTSLAKKKARLVFTTVDPSRVVPGNDQATSYEFGPGLAAVTLPGVFAGRRLDIGTRFLLENLPSPADGQAVLDLGCGNGIVGVSQAVATPSCSVTFVDISFLALASAKATHARAFPEGRDDAFVISDGADALESASFDRVVINPPFHDQHVVGDETARQMFADAKRVLRSGGELWVVANRHLGHHVKINHEFGIVKTMTSNPKFVILRAVVA